MMPDFPNGNIESAIMQGCLSTDNSFLTALYDDFKIKFAETK